MPTAALYDEDFFAWTRLQAEALRKLSARRDLPNDLDPLRVAEEIEDVGSEKLGAATSFLTQILIHLLKLAARPDDDPPAAHWRDEILTFQIQLLAKYQPSMRQYLETERIWRRAVSMAGRSMEMHGQRLEPMPDECPFDIHGLALDEPIDIAARVIELRAATKA